MKKLFTIILCCFTFICLAQKGKKKSIKDSTIIAEVVYPVLTERISEKVGFVILDSSIYDKYEWRCGVAHMNKDGGFSCDFKGTYYPFEIYDSTIRKWFIKIVNGDSLFYYRHDVEKLFVWRKKSKAGMYGYEHQDGYEGCGTTIGKPYDKSIGDTLRIKEQVWNKHKN